MHTYAFHDLIIIPLLEFLIDLKNEFSDLEIINKSMENVHQYAISQYNSVKDYLKKIGVEKEVHIGELGWSTVSNELYGEKGTHAADEYKQALFFDKIREWTTKEKISCFILRHLMNHGKMLKILMVQKTTLDYLLLMVKQNMRYGKMLIMGTLKD